MSDSESPEQEIDRLFELLSDLPLDQRQARFDRLEVEPAMRTQVERMLALFDEPRQGLERFIPTDEWQGLGEGPLERLGQFEIERILGEGGMGVVYLATRPMNSEDGTGGADEQVALKVMRVQLEGDALRGRFQREVEVLERLNHPGICGFLEAGEEPFPYLAMEFIDGRPLHEHARLADLSDVERVELLARVCDAMHYAHERNVIHRDLKPNNVLVASIDGDRIGQPKVLDFGVARALGDSFITLTQTGTGALIGTVAYMSPEQVSGDTRELDARSDVYSLGVLLFEVLTGRLHHAFRDQPMQVVMRMIQEGEPARLGSVVDRLEGPIERVVAKALEKDPERRYPTAAALAADLRRFTKGEMVAARGSSWGGELRKFARRHRVLTAGAVGSGLALTLGMATTAWFASGQFTARAEADLRAAEARIGVYRATLSSVGSAIRADDAHIARLGLEAVRREDRGWEWRHLSAAIDESVALFSDPGALPGAGLDFDSCDMAFRGNGQRLELWGDGRTVSIDLSTRRIVSSRSLGGAVRGPGAIRTGRLGGDGSLQLETPGERVVQRVELPAGALELLAIFAEPPFACIRYQEHCLLVDTATGNQRTIDHLQDSDYPTVDSARHWLAWSTSTGFRVLDLRASEPPFVYDGARWKRVPLSLSPDGALLAYADERGRLTQWSLASGRDPVVRSRWNYGNTALDAVTYSKDGKWIASSGGGRIMVNSLEEGELLWSFMGHGLDVFALEFSEDLQLLASLGHGEVVRFWELQAQDPRVLVSGASYLYSARFDATGERIYVGTPTGELLVYDSDSSAEVARIELSTPERGPVLINWLTNDGTHGLVAVGGAEGEVFVVDEATGRIEYSDVQAGRRCVSFSPGGERLAVTAEAGLVLVKETSGWSDLKRRELPLPATGVRYSPNGELLAVGMGNGIVHVLNADSLETVAEMSGIRGAVRGLGFDEQGRFLVAAVDWEVLVLELDSFRTVARLELPGLITCVAFAPGGERLVAGSYGGEIHVIDTDSWEVLTALQGHSDYVYSVDFSPDGETLLSAGGDGTARIWGTRSLSDLFAARESYRVVAARVAPIVDRFAAQAESSDEAVHQIRSTDRFSEREREVALQVFLGRLLGL